MVDSILATSPFKTFLIVFGMAKFSRLVSFTVLVSSIGLKSTFKVILRYPEIISVIFYSPCVFAAYDIESKICSLPCLGDSIQTHPITPLIPILQCLVTCCMTNHYVTFHYVCKMITNKYKLVYYNNQIYSMVSSL